MLKIQSIKQVQAESLKLLQPEATPQEQNSKTQTMRPERAA
jgi:hypothetical protein